MASITLSTDQLSSVLCQLRDDDRAYFVRGEMRSKLDSVVTDYDFVADSWPDLKALVVRVDTSKTEYAVYLGTCITAYAKDTDAFETLLKNNEVVDWSSEFWFVYVHESLRSPILKLADLYNVNVKEREYVTMTVDKEKLQMRSKPEGFTIRSLKPEQAHLVNSSWKFNMGKHSEVYIQELIEKLQSCCLYNTDGDVVGFALRYHFGALGMLYVLEQYRGKGYAKVIISNLANQCLQNEKEVCVQIEKDNLASIRLHEGCGFAIIPNLRIFEFEIFQ